MQSKSKTEFSRDRMPVLGTWVTLVQSGTKGSKARRSNTQSAPALISAVSDGTVTVLYPNNLVMTYGFKGEPVKRVVGVPVEKLKQVNASDVGLQLLQKAILTAVKIDACARIPTTPVRRVPATPQPEPLSGEIIGQGERSRSRSRSPLRNETSPPQTPRNRVKAGHDADSRSLARQDTDDKVSAFACPARQPEEDKMSVSLCAGIAAIATPRSDVERRPSAEQESICCRSPKSIAGRKAALTSRVSRELRGSSTYGQLTRDALEASLLKGGFDSVEISHGLQRLDDANKIMLLDSLVFLI